MARRIANTTWRLASVPVLHVNHDPDAENSSIAPSPPATPHPPSAFQGAWKDAVLVRDLMRPESSEADWFSGAKANPKYLFLFLAADHNGLENLASIWSNDRFV